MPENNVSNPVVDPYTRLLTFRCDAIDTPLCDITRWLWRTVPYILVALGTCGCILSFSILCRRKPRKQSIPMYLLFLSVSDLTVLWTTVLNFSKVIAGSTREIQDLSDFACVIYRWLVMVAVGTSHWVLVLVTLERAIVTKYPHKAKHLFSRKTSLFAIMSLIVFLMIFHGHLLFGFQRSIVSLDIIAGNTTIRYTQLICAFSSERYASFFLQIYLPGNLVFSFIVPIGLVVSGNTIIGVLLFKHKRSIVPSLQNVTTDGSGSSGTGAHADLSKNSYIRQLHSVTIMLLTVGAVFVLSSSPVLIFLQFVPGLSLRMNDSQFTVVQLIYSILSFLALCNYTFNFLLYFVPGRIFHREWKAMKVEVTEFVRKLNCLCVRPRNDTTSET